MTLEGQRLDRYHIVHLLGSGGTGDVYLAQDPRIGQQVAIKVIRMEAGLNPEQLNEIIRLFQREVKAIVALDHPHILSLYDYGEESIANARIIYLVMPYRPEGSLTQWLRGRSQQGFLSPQDVTYLIRQAAEALQHAHDHQIIHQDVKPSNFLLRARKETPTRPDLLLADFSIARLGDATSNVSQSVRGTPTYMAPEQWQGQPVFATDQYALAIMAYELLCGHPPFQGSPHQMMYHHLMEQPQPPSQANTRLPAAVDTVLLRALTKRAQERFPSITAFADALQQATESPQGTLRAVLALSAEEAERGTTRTITLPPGRPLAVTIPAKVQSGHLIYLVGEGDLLPESGQRGDLLLTIQIKQEGQPLPSGEMLERTARSQLAQASGPVPRVQPVQMERKTPVLPPGVSDAAPQHNPYEISPPITPDETLAPTRTPTSGETWIEGGRASNPTSLIPPPPPDYRSPVPVPGKKLPQPDPAKQRIMRIVLGAATALLLILSMIVGIGTYQDYSALNTLQGQQDAATTAQQRATYVANQAATSTATTGTYPSYLPGKGTPVLFDPLHQPGAWDNENDKTGGTCQFTGGAYHVRETKSNTFNSSCVGAFSFSDFAFEVEMTIIQGDCGGALFRDDNANSKNYMFEICQYGVFDLVKYIDNTGKNAPSLVPRQTHATIKTGVNQTNVVAVVARGPQITLFINKQQVATLQDKNYTEGSIALIASPDMNPTEVVFRNMKIWTF